MKVIFACHLLKKRIAVVLEGTALSIPIDGKRINAEVFCFLDLLLQHSRILRRVSRIDVPRRAKPGLIVGQQPWCVVDWMSTLIQRLAKAVAIASLAGNDHAGENQNYCGRLLHLQTSLCEYVSILLGPNGKWGKRRVPTKGPKAWPPGRLQGRVPASDPRQESLRPCIADRPA